MNYPTLYRLSGAAAIAGGLLRIASSFPITQDEITLQWLYTASISCRYGPLIYLQRAERLGFLGLTAALVVAALAVHRRALRRSVWLQHLRPRRGGAGDKAWSA